MYNCHRFSLVTTELAASKSSNAKKMRPWRSSTLTLLGSFRKAALPQTPKNRKTKTGNCLEKRDIYIYIIYKTWTRTLLNREANATMRYNEFLYKPTRLAPVQSPPQKTL